MAAVSLQAPAAAPVAPAQIYSSPQAKVSSDTLFAHGCNIFTGAAHGGPHSRVILVSITNEALFAVPLR
jgi:hypothetical protein